MSPPVIDGQPRLPPESMTPLSLLDVAELPLTFEVDLAEWLKADTQWARTAPMDLSATPRERRCTTCGTKMVQPSGYCRACLDCLKEGAR